MDEDQVERSPQPQRPHVSEQMFTVFVQLSAQCQHLGGTIRQRAAEPALQVEGVVPGAGAELEEHFGLARCPTQQERFIAGRLVAMILDGIKETVPPRREFTIDQHGAVFRS
jgi:hypothetical protein